MKRKIRLTFARRDALIGIFFMTPFIIGTIVFFAYPLITSFLLSFGYTDKGSVGINIVFTGLENYIRAFKDDAQFLPDLLSTISDAAIEIPLIIIFSLLIAIALNKVTKCKAFFRVAILLPFLISSSNVMANLLGIGVDKNVLVFSNGIFSTELNNMLGGEISELLDLFFNKIVVVLWSSSVQILLFLSAIQSINPAMYEAAKIDGATEYSVFWKITLPTILPILLLNTVYTMINTFTNQSNKILKLITSRSLYYAEHGYAATLGWIYFAVVLIFIFITTFIIQKCTKATYSNEVKQ